MCFITKIETCWVWACATDTACWHIMRGHSCNADTACQPAGVCVYGGDLNVTYTARYLQCSYHRETLVLSTVTEAGGSWVYVCVCVHMGVPHTGEAVRTERSSKNAQMDGMWACEKVWSGWTHMTVNNHVCLWTWEWLRPSLDTNTEHLGSCVPPYTLSCTHHSYIHTSTPPYS